MTKSFFTPEYLDTVFPPERTDLFFEALFGGEEEGAYDIRLRFEHSTATELTFAFYLLERPGKCLACNLTYGLPQVFSRHPILAINDVVQTLCACAGLEAVTWRLLPTQSQSKELHKIPLILSRT